MTTRTRTIVAPNGEAVTTARSTRYVLIRFGTHVSGRPFAVAVMGSNDLARVRRTKFPEHETFIYDLVADCITY